MRLRFISETKDKDFFSYVELSKDMWRKKVKDAQDEFDVHFDLENDYDVAQRQIEIPQSHWEHTKCKFNCELYSAGGDWESPVLYFRCQLKDGYAKGVSTYGLDGGCFIYIPGKNDGNESLVANKNGGFNAADSDAHDKMKPDERKSGERKAWDSLKTHLQKLVDDEIKEVSKNK